MPIVAKCEHCGQRYSLPREAIGENKACRICKKSFRVADPYPKPRATASGSIHGGPQLSQPSPQRKESKLWRPLFLSTLGLMCLLLPLAYSLGRTHATVEPFRHVEQAWSEARSLTPEPGRYSSGRSLYDRASESVVLIHKIGKKGGESRGTGFILHPGNKLVTNQHVVEGANHVIVETYWGQQIALSHIEVIDEERDLAVLPLPKELTDHGLKIASKSHAIGDAAFTIGSPGEQTFRFSEGRISRFENGSPRNLWLDIHGDPGASGSPVLDSDGNVLAIIFAKNFDSGLIKAVHYSELRELLESSDGSLQRMKGSGELTIYKPSKLDGF